MLQVSNLIINYNGRDLFSPINLDIPVGSIHVLMGASGIGKTSILNAIAKNIKYSGIITASKNFTVFQDSHQLFPWFSIRKNLDLVCTVDYNSCVDSWQLKDLLDNKPDTISGGQRQRFTLIRAMYSGAQLLLCDEPLSGLDSMTRYFVLQDMKTKIAELGLTVLWISHDLSEAKFIGDKLWLLTQHGLESINKDIDDAEFIKKLSH